MKIMIVGDVVGAPGRDAVKALVPILRARHKLDFVIVNCESIAGGAGVTPKTAQDLLSCPGIDMLTSGQHILTSSTLIKQIVEIGTYDVQHLARLVPLDVAERLRERLGSD